MPDDRPEEEAKSPKLEEEADAPKAVPLLALDSQALVGWFSGVLASRAWVDMGLLADPATGKVQKKLDSARLAIDAFEALSKILKPTANPDDARKMDALLTDLRLNFVRQAGPQDS